jgi:hypothetical protein
MPADSRWDATALSSADAEALQPLSPIPRSLHLKGDWSASPVVIAHAPGSWQLPRAGIVSAD